MKNVIVSILAAASLVACSKPEEPVNSAYQPSDTAIQLGAGSISASARSVYEDITTSTTKSLPARVIGVLNASDFTSPINANADATIDFDAMNATDYAIGTAQVNKKGFPTPVYYPVNSSTAVYITGLYPAGSIWNVTTTGASATIDGKTDLMTAPYLTTYKTDAQGATTAFKNLFFAHHLTLINISLKAETSGAIAVWGEISSIELAKIDNAAPANMLTATFVSNAANNAGVVNTTTISGGGATLPTYLTGSDSKSDGTNGFALTTTSTAVTYVLAPYFDVNAGNNAGKITLNLKSANNSTVLSVPVDINANGSGLTMGQAYDVTITFKATEIMATATVAPWVIGGSGSAVIE